MTLDELRTALPDWIIWRVPGSGLYMAARRGVARKRVVVKAPSPETLHYLIERLN